MEKPVAVRLAPWAVLTGRLVDADGEPLALKKVTFEYRPAPDVGAIGNYLACNLDTKAELVVLIRRGATILGQLDIDSDVPAGFGEQEHATVREVADALAVLL